MGNERLLIISLNPVALALRGRRLNIVIFPAIISESSKLEGRSYGHTLKQTDKTFARVLKAKK